MRRLTLVSTLIILLTLILVACGGGEEAEPEPAAPAGDAAAGQVAFQQTCGACHGADAKGLPNLGKDMTTSTFIKEQSDEQLLAFIKTGRSVSDPANTTGVDMPPKGGNPSLTDDQLQDIIAYIRSVSQ